jgi:two-component system sensor histidine kinase YesM
MMLVLSKMFKQKKSVRSTLILLIVIAILVPSVIVTAIYSKVIQSSIDEEIDMMHRNSIDSIAHELNNFIQDVSTLNSQIIEALISLELLQDQDKLTRLHMLQRLDETLGNLRRRFDFTHSIIIVDQKENFTMTSQYTRLNKLLSQPWFTNFKDMEQGSIFIPNHKVEYYYNEMEVVSFITKMEVWNNKAETAIIQVDILTKFFTEFFGSYNLNDTQIILKDETGNIIYESALLDSDENVVKYNRVISNSGWDLSVYFSTDNIETQYREARNLVIKITFLVILLGIIIAIQIARIFTDPLRPLMKSMAKVGDGVFDPIQMNPRFKEFDELQSGYNIMLERINELMRIQVENERDKRDAEFAALQAQINPHFIANTINGIKWLAIMKKTDLVAESLAQLGSILRFCFESKDLVSLENELNFIYSYVQIQKIRFSDKILIEIDIPEELKSCQIPKFLIQPLVENSIIHGFKNTDFAGVIKIICKKIDDKILIHVEDDGEGLIESSPNKLTGIGLKNIKNRMHLIYGTESNMNVYQISPRGTVVELLFPIIRNEEPVHEV